MYFRASKDVGNMNKMSMLVGLGALVIIVSVVVFYFTYMAEEETNDNEAPVAMFTTGSGLETFLVGDIISFDANDSVDNETQKSNLTFTWDFDGDDSFDDATGVSATWYFNDTGMYTVRLRVDDGEKRGSASLDLWIIAPVGNMTVQDTGAPIRANYAITLSNLNSTENVPYTDVGYRLADAGNNTVEEGLVSDLATSITSGALIIYGDIIPLGLSNSDTFTILVLNPDDSSTIDEDHTFTLTYMPTGSQIATTKLSGA